MFTHRLEYRLWRRRRRRRRIILALLAALLLAAVLHGGGGHARNRHDAHTAATHRARQNNRPKHADAHPRGTTTGAAAPSITMAGTGLHWTGFHGIELPNSVHDGPHHERNGLAWGFADTPRGALLAAVNIAVRTAPLWGPAIFEPTIRNQVTGPDAPALLRADVNDYAALRAAAPEKNGRPAGRGYAAEAAYRFLAFSPAAATVDIVTEAPGTSTAAVMTATRIGLAWQHGDWLVIAPPGGDWANSATPVSSLTGYTTFANEG